MAIPEDYHTADGKPTCGYEFGAMAPCRRDPGHGGDHYNANGEYFKTQIKVGDQTAGHWYTR